MFFVLVTVMLPMRENDRGTKKTTMRDESGAWEEEYRAKGAVWGGAVHHLPFLPAGSRVLELGCGNGKTLSAMTGRGWNVAAIDFSKTAVTLSRMKTGMQQNADACMADARRLPFATDRFDAVFAIHILSHLSGNDRPGAAAEAVRVLKTGGVLYFSGFSLLDFRSGKGAAVEPGSVMRGLGIRTHYFTEPETRDLFSTLTLQAITTVQWSMRVRGQEFPRAEIQAIFIK